MGRRGVKMWKDDGRDLIRYSCPGIFCLGVNSSLRYSIHTTYMWQQQKYRHTSLISSCAFTYQSYALLSRQKESVVKLRARPGVQSSRVLSLSESSDSGTKQNIGRKSLTTCSIHHLRRVGKKERQLADSKNGIGGDRRSGDSIWHPATGHQPHRAEATAGTATAGRATSTSLTLFQLWPCVAKHLNAR